MDNKLVSVIVPVYNVEKYLKECVDSLLNQTYNNLEIILVDDGSTDNSGQLCDDYALQDNRIKVIHKQNGGLSDARNFGLNNATGYWVMFIDSDDFIDLDTIEKLINASLDKDLVLCRMLKDYTDGTKSLFYETTLEALIEQPYNLAYAIHDRIHHEKDGKFVTDCIHCSVCRALYKRDIIEKNNLRFITVRAREDVPFTLQYLSLTTKAGLVDEYLYHYRMIVGSLTHQVKYKPKLFEERKVLLSTELDAILTNQHLSDKEKKYLALTQNAKLWWEVVCHECLYNPNYKKQLNFYRKKGGVKNPISFAFLFYLLKQKYSFKRVAMFLLIKLKWWGLFKKFIKK